MVLDIDGRINVNEVKGSVSSASSLFIFKSVRYISEVGVCH